MPSGELDRTKIRTLTASLIVVAAIGALLWYGVPSFDELFTAVQARIGVPVSVVLPDPRPAGVAAAAAVPAAPAAIGVPVRVRIPKLRVNSAIVKVALAADGSMGIPKKALDVAWYGLGPRPGETGSAVLSGHINWYYGAIGAFANLSKLKPGDKITVQDDQGAIISFVVRESRTYDAAKSVPEVFVSADGKAHLNLITCAGVWDKRAKQYTLRLVVFADKETK